jgi:hypothetical protein
MTDLLFAPKNDIGKKTVSSEQSAISKNKELSNRVDND